MTGLVQDEVQKRIVGKPFLTCLGCTGARSEAFQHQDDQSR